ncbi:N-acetyl-lysine deacetylase [Sulfolobus sp. A20]|uniref:N-acetyl-lysine deacetylase n=1 Tax=Saccharolobus sp. A20 TaxID=1891280 RepID=UPI000846100F|nr:N-acetyl-lysine deacetylase [Sulfolobus sp. A20]TRM74819.1 N-acetyl-lysine deacetylase [Sulfolobus sp. A20-N-F8]TRM78010.1 N-acetyl-lysine deacetylase [Sulfolobus sp. B5]TRM82531.1 N-acetyl-lysine deacetylase [Sulfolobus sp. D5]TRM91296.1 N-acetyl-lysine deacetylase [Sulfolobus sp. A20-N-G8]TRN01573.1 N-acetyl-lysine deacetylase [Sulfolobus sp. F1]TRN01827.1 N-acetyl-lysine deacetylase [Sulfolobus sp. E1]
MLQEKELVKQKAKELLLDILSIYTPSKNERTSTAFFEKISNQLNLKLKILPKSNSFILGEGDVLLASHVDTVPGFIPPKEEGETIYGRGAVDAKGPLVGMILAAWLLNERGIKVTVAALTDEESTSIGARELVSLSSNYRHCIVGEPTNTTDIVIEYRGSIQLDIQCYGNSEHSSSARNNLIVDISKKILEIYKPPEKFDKVSIVPTVINAGDTFNVTPSKVYLHLDIRYAINDNRDRILDEVQNIFKECEIKVIDETPPVKVSTNNDVVKSLMRALLKQQLKPRLVRKAGTSDMNILNKICYNIAGYGPGNSSLEHTDQEKISLDEIYIGVKTYMLAIEELWQKRS